eukprot:scaffold8483_cov78-Skeletonema_dohrnii-CCMP3373.AAC.1
MQSTRSYPRTQIDTDSSERPCKRRCITKKKTITFSSRVKVRSFANGHDMQGYSSWLTSDKLSSIRKRAKKLSMIHYIKTRPGQPKAPSNRSGIVYNCHPAHYEIIGESLRGMEHYTDISKARRREQLRSDGTELRRPTTARVVLPNWDSLATTPMSSEEERESSPSSVWMFRAWLDPVVFIEDSVHFVVFEAMWIHYGTELPSYQQDQPNNNCGGYELDR